MDDPDYPFVLDSSLRCEKGFFKTLNGSEEHTFTDRDNDLSSNDELLPWIVEDGFSRVVSPFVFTRYLVRGLWRQVL